MSNGVPARDICTCLGGFLGMFLGAMLGFAICMKFMFDRINNDDGSMGSNVTLLPFLGVVAAGCVGIVAGALLFRFAFAVFAKLFPPAKKGS